MASSPMPLVAPTKTATSPDGKVEAICLFEERTLLSSTILNVWSSAQDSWFWREGVVVFLHLPLLQESANTSFIYAPFVLECI